MLVAMDDLRLGALVRAVRQHRGWRQLDLAAAAAVSASFVSLIERGHLDSVALRTLRRVLGVSTSAWISADAGAVVTRIGSSAPGTRRSMSRLPGSSPR
jgi:transcriptional regulator with XRE-family HTH domain